MQRLAATLLFVGVFTFVIGFGALAAEAGLPTGELISNGSFEELDDNGLPVGFGTFADDPGALYGDSSVARTGTTSLRIGATSNQRNALSLRVPVEGGVTYELSVWFRAPELLSRGAGRSIYVRVQLQHPEGNSWNDEWVQLAPADAPYEVSISGSNYHLLYVHPRPYVSQSPDDPTDWHPLAVTITLPPGVSGSLVLNLFNEKGNGVVWFDDFSIVATPN